MRSHFKMLVREKPTQVEVQSKMASDQTVPDKSDLWSDRLGLKCHLIRLSCARSSVCDLSALKNLFWSEYCAFESHALIRLVYAQIRLWSDWSAFKMVWSENDFDLEQISQYRYKICISWKLMLSLLLSTKEKPIIANENKTRKIAQKMYWVCHLFMLLTE